MSLEKAKRLNQLLLFEGELLIRDEILLEDDCKLGVGELAFGQEQPPGPLMLQLQKPKQNLVHTKSIINSFYVTQLLAHRPHGQPSEWLGEWINYMTQTGRGMCG